MRCSRLAGLATVLLLAACGSAADDTRATGSDASTGTDAVATTDDLTAPAVAGDVADPGAAADANATGDSPTEASGDGGVEPQAGGTEAPVPPGLKPLAGSYRYHAVGTATVNGAAQPIDVEATTLIEEVSASDQRETSSGGQQGSAIQVMRYSSDKVELVSLEMKGAVNKKFEPKPPVLYAPVPGSVGQSWSWNATSTDRLTRIQQSSRFDRTEQKVVGAQTIDVVVVETDITITGDIKATGHITSWVSPAYKLVVRSHSTLTGSYGAFTFASDVTSDLLDLRPEPA